jgi:hypothetical protein
MKWKGDNDDGRGEGQSEKGGVRTQSVEGNVQIQFRNTRRIVAMADDINLSQIRPSPSK